jgi:diaminopimelate decarboxylase
MDLRNDSSNYIKELIRKLNQSQETHAIVLLPEGLDAQITKVKAAFPANSLHSVALKTNPLLHSLSHLVKQEMGLECASAEEVELARAAGAEKTAILWDSPAKTTLEIQGLKSVKNLWIQVDSIEELHIHSENLNPDANYALRFTPSNLTGRKDNLNVSGKTSKFGVQLDRIDDIVLAFDKYPFLNGIHIHGSSMEFDTTTKVNQLNEVLVVLSDRIKNIDKRIKFINIGGGLGYDYSGVQEVDLTSYSNEVSRVLSKFNLHEKKLLTEFGRYYHAPYSDSISRVEYVKERNLILHFGADSFLREAYGSNPISFNVSLFDSNGSPKIGKQEQYNLCGPLCFGGDIIQKHVALPHVEKGDFIVIHETGANTFSLWSRHCSRAFPSVYEWNNQQLCKVKKREGSEDVVKFWS